MNNSSDGNQTGGVSTLTDIDAALHDLLDRPWTCIVWDDPVNLMSYVVFVLQKIFRFPKEKANELMLLVHHEGRAVVASGSREEMERHVQQLHEHGLWATLQRDDKI
jgi:ATP-dependent Clp protease adaptor protein ClpS